MREENRSCRFIQPGKQVGLFLSLAACALVVGTQSKCLLQRPTTAIRASSRPAELGLESALPHLRVDLAAP
jgi:hypothetical protein